MKDKRAGKRVKNDRSSQRISYELNDLFELFKRLRRSEGISDATFVQYNNNFRFFSDYLDSVNIPLDIRHIDDEIIRDYIIYMRDEIVRFDKHRFKSEAEKTVGLAPSTINTRLKTLKTMFNRLFNDGYISVNPVRGIRNVAEYDSEIEILSETELKSLFKAPNQRRYADFRDYVLMNFLLDSMARIGETTKLKIHNFDFNSHLVNIPAEIAKNRRHRIIPLNTSTIRLVKELVQENESDFDTDYVFLTNYGEPLTPDHFRKRLNNFALKVGINKNIHPHLFRHTGATMFLENGGDIRHLQKLLGHSDLRMVERYTHLSNMSITKQHAKYSGINNVLSKQSKPRKIKR